MPTLTDLLPTLSDVAWSVANRTYGSSHATWIGLLVEWWIRLDAAHSALDGAPSFGVGRVGQADALFCDAAGPAGVLEVEGSWPERKIAALEKYFRTRRPELRSLWFGVLVLYSYTAAGSGSRRSFPAAEEPRVVQAARRMSGRCPHRSLIVLALDRQFHRCDGVCGTSEYYAGTLRRVTGIHLRNGNEVGRKMLFETNGS